MTTYDPTESWRWEEERDRAEREVLEHEGRLARDTGDSRWGTGGMPAEEFHPHAHPETHMRRRGPFPRRAIARHAVPSSAAWEPEDERLAGPYAGIPPRGYRRSDERVREDICERFTAHGYLDPSDVEVAVQNGEAMLTGTVATRAQKRLAEDLAEGVPGVTEVCNHLRVQSRGPGEGRVPPSVRSP
jgi:hypothetical protein